MKKETILLILFVHFVADFILQTDEMAINKSKSNQWLTIHVAAYMAGFILMTVWFIESQYWLHWILLNGALHWITDYFTSRLNSYLWKKEMRHWFFVGIGADQFIHYACLLISYQLLIL